MATKKSNWLDEHRGLVIVGIIAVFLVIFAISSTQQSIQTDKNPASASSKLETLSADAVKSNINLYYIANGYYPVTYEDMIAEFKNSKPGDYGENSDGATLAKDAENAIQDLKDFKYSRRGDDQACQFTYLNSANKTVTVSVDYRSEYH